MIWFWIILLVILAVFMFAAGQFFHIAVARSGGFSQKQNKDNGGSPWDAFKERMDKDKKWDEEQKMEDVWITDSQDHLKLHALYFPAEKKAERIVLCAHGFHGAPFMDFCCQTPWLHRTGCDLLLIDERAHGSSEGEYITYGAKERYDIQQWTEYLNERSQGKLPIYLYGISMGSASVMMTSALELPKSTAGIIADCGYTSFHDTIIDEAKRVLHFPAYPTIWILDLYCRLFAGFKISDADAEKALKTGKHPVLFLQGTEDQFVLPVNSEKNYAACIAEKKLVWIEGAGHASAYLKDSELYEKSVEEFFGRCEK